MSYEADSEFPTIVIDNGSDMIKAGFAGDDAPRVMVPSIIGRPRHPVSESLGEKYYVGEEVEPRRGILTCKYPIEHGIVCNWDDMELVWKHIFEKELRRSASDHAVLMSEDALNPRACREKTAQVMFEKFNLPAFRLAATPCLAAYGYGKLTCLSVDSGNITMIVPVYEGAVIPHAVPRFNVAGKDIMLYLASLLHRRGYDFITADYKHIKQIKALHCYVAADYEQELAKGCEAKEYTMPDGRTISIGTERFQCPEAMFRESLLANERYGLPEAIRLCVKRCDADLQCLLLQNIILTGGNTLLPGFAERLKFELVKLFPDQVIEIRAAPERKSSVWIGGSIYVCQGGFKQGCISRGEYEEFGPSIVERKCRP